MSFEIYKCIVSVVLLLIALDTVLGPVAYALSKSDLETNKSKRHYNLRVEESWCSLVRLASARLSCIPNDIS